MLARRIVLAIAVVAVALAIMCMPRQDPGPSVPPIRIRVMVSPDAWEADQASVLTEPFRQLSSQGIEVLGRPIQVLPVAVDSGDAEYRIASGEDDVDVWIPASSLWGRLLNHDANESRVPPRPASLLRSPQVFAVWKSIANDLGWPERSLEWSDVLRFSEDKGAWAELTGREGAVFTFAHTNPGLSTSGLSAAISEYYIAAGKTEDLSEADIAGAGHQIEQMESMIVHYGSTSFDILGQLACNGESYAAAVYIQATSMRRFNDPDEGYDEDCPAADTGRLVAVGPTQGTFVADYPCIPLRTERDDVTQRASRVVCRWLAAWMDGHPDHIDAFNFGDEPLGRSLEMPSGEVIAAVQGDWRNHRRPADVMVAIDISGSMGTDLAIFADEVNRCLDVLMPKDRVGLLTFGSTIEEEVPLKPFRGRHQEAMQDALDDLFPNAESTRLRGGIGSAVQAIRDDYAHDRINAAVIISDGAQPADPSSISTNELLTGLARRARPVRVFVIAYGDQVDIGFLDDVAHVTGGRVFRVSEPIDATPGAGHALCQEVFAYF